MNDGLVISTVGHVPSQSNRLYATVFSAYIVFGYTMYQILLEFRWYIQMRHKFLRKPLPRHFTVFVRNIPPEYRNNQRLEAFFRSCFSEDAVLEARLCLNAPNLAKAVAQRDDTVANLERTQALFQRDGIRPRHNPDRLAVLSESVDSIEYYTSQLQEQNRDVARRIDALEVIARGERDPSQGLDPTPAPTRVALPLPSTNESGFLNAREIQPPRIGRKLTDTSTPGLVAMGEESATSGSVVSSISGAVPRTLRRTVCRASSVASTATSAATEVANRAATIVMGGEDGEIFPAGFVVFTKLSTANAALQMIHHEEPFAIELHEAPDPEDGKWE